CRITLACPPVPAALTVLDAAAALGVETATLDLDGDDAPARLTTWLAGRGFDVLHLHAGIAWEDLPAAAAGRAAGVPVVIRTEHLPYLLSHPWYRAEHARMLPHLDRLVCVSAGARATYLAAGAPPSKVAVIRNGVTPRPATRARAEIRAALGLADDEPAILTVARLSPQKDHRTLLAAIPAILAREPRARFLWVGAGPLEARLRWAVRAAGLGRSVRMLGARDDVTDLLAAADLFVLPSRFEGLPLVLIEAMAAGLPVVATRVCGTDEVVDHGRTGLLARSRDPDDLARAVSAVLASPARGAALGAAGRERSARDFGAARMVGETLALYGDLAAGAEAGCADAPPRPGPELHSAA
ncbi:MAG TPA: glycosyltransferase, partial [Geminicoccaceae bacterium]